MEHIAIDFETYYNTGVGCDVKTLGPERYTEHPDFEVYLVAIIGPGIDYCGPVAQAPWDKFPKEWIGLAHNARFEAPIFEYLVKHNLTNGVAPVDWKCTADLAAYMRSGRSLAEAARSLLKKPIDKTARTRMDGKRYADLPDERKFEMIAYCRNDAILCRELWLCFGPLWPLWEQELSALNRKLGMRGVRVDTALLETFVRFTFEEKKEAAKAIPWEWPVDKTPLQMTKVVEFCRKEGVPAPESLAEDSNLCEQWVEKYGGSYSFVGAMRRWRKANIIERKVRAMKRRVDAEGRMPYAVKYFGSHTGRFSGENAVNMLNQSDGEVVDDKSMRNLILPDSPEHKLAIIDWAQIEPRVLLTLVGDTRSLDRIRSGESIYEVHARNTMGWSGGKMKEENPEMYKLAKARVLGLGYGAGWKTFQMVALREYNLVLTDDEAQAQVQDYRKENQLITSFWRRMQVAARRAHACGEDLVVNLPSGRELRYSNMRYEMNNLIAEPVIGSPRKIYGSKLVENIVQAIARDIFGQKMLKLEGVFARLLFHVHDEYVFSLNRGSSNEGAIERVKKILCEPVEWLPSCPLNVEIHFEDSYCK